MSNENPDDADELDGSPSSDNSRATLIGLWVAATILAGVLATLFQFFFHPNPQSIATLFIATGITLGVQGLLFGLLQWLVLQSEIRRAYWWILATLLGTLIGVYVELAAYYLLIQPIIMQVAVGSPTSAQIIALVLNVISSSVFSGTAIGIAQWLVLRRAANRASLWIPVTMLSMFLRYVVSTGITVLLNGLLGTVLPRFGLPINPSTTQIVTPVIVAMVGNFAFGMFSGWVLASLLADSEIESDDEELEQEVLDVESGETD